MARPKLADEVHPSTILAVGQDLGSVVDYLSVFGATPDYTVMSYTALDDLAGLAEPVDYGSGVEHAAGLLDAFPDAHLQLGLYLAGRLEAIGAGAYDAHISSLGRFLGVYTSQGRRAFVRVGYECDGPQNRHDPDAYKAAFRRVAFGLRAHAATVEVVWHSWARGNVNNYLGLGAEAWWPGHDAVDWVAVSLFDQLYPTSDIGVGPAEEIAALGRRWGKPLMVAESAPIGLGVAYSPTVVHAETAWDEWFAPALSFVERQSVGLWSYINADWEAQPMWANEGWGDTRIQAYPSIASCWKREVLEAQRFTAGAPLPLLPPLEQGRDENNAPRWKREDEHGVGAPFGMLLVAAALVVVGAVLRLRVSQVAKQRRLPSVILEVWPIAASEVFVCTEWTPLQAAQGARQAASVPVLTRQTRHAPSHGSGGSSPTGLSPDEAK